LASLHAGNLNNTIYLHFSTVSRVNEGFYFLVLKNRSDFDDFCFHILFEIRNILVGAHKYCLNNNFAIYTNIKMRYNENREIRGGMIFHRLKRQTAKIKIDLLMLFAKN
jgi:hypothetical protein